ncbi:MAG TPA: HAD-IC family P-type ATPase, partial [Anaerolineales bacterium]|nr:HAD-IC family P-type ATPase [Anaerolineales bacterium]
MNTTMNHNTHDPSNHEEEPMMDHSIHEGMDHSMESMDHSMHEGMDHSQHAGHNIPANMDHSAHAGHKMSGSMDHSAHAGHGADHSGHEQMFRVRFWWSLLLSIPVLVYSEMIQHWLGFTPPMFPLAEWLPFVFSVVIFVYGGIPFLQMATPELKERKPGMMTLISLAISVAFIYSVAAEFIDLGEGFFWELVTLIDIMLLGHWLEMRSVRQASGALNELTKLMPDTAERIIKGSTTATVSVSDLKHGDLILVRPGTSVPADGEVVGGFSDVSEAMITGESKPVHKHKGEKVIAGTLNGDGSLRVKVTATGDETALAGIMRLVEQAQQSKSKTQVLADKAAGWLFYIALASAILTAIAWTIADTFNIEVLNRVVTVLVIACPHALGLAVPLVVAITTAMGAKNGILVRNRLVL